MLIPLNSVQLNIIAMVDAGGALAKLALGDDLFMVDNAVDSDGNHSAGQGTSALSTLCTQGQVINWIICPIDTSIRARISDIRFLDADVCTNLQIYGPPDVPMSPAYIPGLTPSYDYWAGIIVPDVPPGRYRYQFQVQMGNTYLTVESPSLNITTL